MRRTLALVLLGLTVSSTAFALSCYVPVEVWELHALTAPEDTGAPTDDTTDRGGPRLTAAGDGLVELYIPAEGDRQALYLRFQAEGGPR